MVAGNIVNPVTGETGLLPPRLEPFGDYGELKQKDHNKDEWPYLPELSYGGGDRSGLYRLRPSGTEGPMPKWNRNLRLTLRNDLSWTRGRHNFKFGLEIERDRKTGPGDPDYAGVYDFGHNADNPLSTGNGYANGLLACSRPTASATSARTPNSGTGTAAGTRRTAGG